MRDDDDVFFWGEGGLSDYVIQRYERETELLTPTRRRRVPESE